MFAYLLVKTIVPMVITCVPGRARKNGLMGGYGAVAAMMGGMMASMMMAALAALAGKAMMTSLLALMMAAFAAMKGGGGGGGGSKTYEVITKPVVSHIDTHSSEVQHEHHGHYRKRSINMQDGRNAESTAQNQEQTRSWDQTNTRNMREKEGGRRLSTGNPYIWENSFSFLDDGKDSESLGRRHQERDPYKLGSAALNEKNSDVMDPFDKTIRYKLNNNSVQLRSNVKIPRSPNNIDTPISTLSETHRENHKEYKRHADDYLPMAFGLYR